MRIIWPQNTGRSRSLVVKGFRSVLPNRVIESRSCAGPNRAWLAAAAAYAGLRDEAERHAGIFIAALSHCVWQDSVREGGPIAWLREPARFQYAGDLERYEQGLAMAGIG
jgi:hypothetical protein